MKNKQWLDKVNAICSALSALAALLALVIVLYPQIKPSNTNHIELANAGNINSQMFLADHYYEVGDLSQSVYWYSVASQTDGEHRAVAINNLAYIYLSYEQFHITKVDIYGDVARMFSTAADSGNVIAAKNLYILLVSNPADLFSAQHDDYIEIAKKVLSVHDDVWDEVQQYASTWEYLEMQTGEIIPPDNNEYRYEFVSVNCAWDNEDYRLVNTYTYKIYQRAEAKVEPIYTYIPINSL